MPRKATKPNIKSLAKILSVSFLASYLNTAYAGIPTAPAGMTMTDGDVVGSLATLGFTILHSGLYLTLIAVILGVIATVSSAFMHARKHSEWGQFVTVLVGGAVVLVLTIALVNMGSSVSDKG